MDFEGDNLFIITQFDLIKSDTDDLFAVYRLADLVNLIINQGDPFSVNKGCSVENQFSGPVFSLFRGPSDNIGSGACATSCYCSKEVLEWREAGKKEKASIRTQKTDNDDRRGDKPFFSRPELGRFAV